MYLKIDLYTCDLDFNNLEEKISISELDRKNNIAKNESTKAFKFKNRRARNNMKNAIYEDRFNVNRKYFYHDEEIIAMRETFTEVFYFFLRKIFLFFI